MFSKGNHTISGCNLIDTSLDRNVSVFGTLTPFNTHVGCDEDVPYSVHITIAAILSLSGIVATCGNILVIYMVSRYRELRKVINIFVVNIALANMFMIVTEFPFTIVASIQRKWEFGDTGCQLYALAGGCSGFVEIVTLAVMSVERYNAVVNCAQQRKIIGTNTRAIYASILIWIYSLIWCCIPFLGLGSYTLEKIGTSCTVNFLSERTLDRIYFCLILTWCFLLPLCIILFCYGKIIYTVVKHNRFMRKSNCHYNRKCEDGYGRRNIKKRERQEKRITGMTFLMVCLFCFAWLPYATVASIGALGYRELITPLVSGIPGVFAKVATMINPIVYGLSNRTFRKARRRRQTGFEQKGSDERTMLKMQQTVRTKSSATVSGVSKPPSSQRSNTMA